MFRGIVTSRFGPLVSMDVCEYAYMDVCVCMCYGCNLSVYVQ